MNARLPFSGNYDMIHVMRIAALLLIVSSGCFSYKPLDLQMRKFIERKPDAESEYVVGVNLASGEMNTFEAHDTWFERVGGTLYLIGRVRRPSDGNSSSEAWDTVPSAQIRQLIIDKDIIIASLDGNHYEANAGDWAIMTDSDTTWQWSAILTLATSISNGSTVSRYNVTIPNSDIFEFELQSFDLWPTLGLGYAGIAVISLIGSALTH